MASTKGTTTTVAESSLNRFAWLIVFALIVFHTVNNYIVIRSDTIPFTQDSGYIYILTVRLLSILPGANPIETLFFIYDSTPTVYPPLFQLVGALMLALFGISQDVALMANIPFLALLFVSTYLLGKYLFGRETALVATVILSFFPGIYSLSRAYMPDFALIAMVTSAVLMLLRTEDFTSRGGCIGFGCTLGLAALTKPAFSLFLIGPFLVVLTRRFIRMGTHNLRGLAINLLLIALVGALIASPWYVLHTREFFQEQKFFMLTLETHRQLIGEDVPRFYPLFRGISLLLLSPVSTLFWISLILYILFFRDHRGMLLSWIGVPIAFFVITGLSGHLLSILRYSPAILPAIALIVGYSLWRSLTSLLHAILAHMKKIDACLTPETAQLVAKVLVILLLLVEMPLFLAISHHWQGDLGDPFRRVTTRGDDIAVLNYLGRTSPQEIGFDLEQTAGFIEEALLDKKQNPVLFLFNQYGASTEAIRTQLDATNYLRSQQIFFDSCLDIRFTGEPTAWRDYDECIASIYHADLVILEGIILEEWWMWNKTRYYDRIIPVNNYIKNHINDFEMLAVMKSPRTPCNNVPKEQQAYTLDSSFDWINCSVWILRKKDNVPTRGRVLTSVNIS